MPFRPSQLKKDWSVLVLSLKETRLKFTIWQAPNSNYSANQTTVLLLVQMNTRAHSLHSTETHQDEWLTCDRRAWLRRWRRSRKTCRCKKTGRTRGRGRAFGPDRSPTSAFGLFPLPGRHPEKEKARVCDMVHLTTVSQQKLGCRVHNPRVTEIIR